MGDNLTGEEGAPSWFPGPTSPYGPLEAVLIGIVLFCVIIVTIVGNILVCIAVCLVRKLRRPCNYLLVSLAVSDLCVAVLVMPMALLYEVLGRWNLGPVMCDVWVSFDVLSCTASILNLCMISVDRYYAITKPLEYGVKRTPKRMIACVSVVWLGAACISLPPLLILGNTHGETTTGRGIQCEVCQNFGYQIYATLGSFYIPLAVMMFVYYKIFRAARRIVLEERRAQTHLETSHCYLEIKNGSGPEARLAVSSSSSPAASTPATAGKHHRTSTTSTNTTFPSYSRRGKQTQGLGSGDRNKRCLDIISNQVCCCSGTGASRPSSESQCPMLGGLRTGGGLRRGRRLRHPGKHGSGMTGSSAAGAGGCPPHSKKLRFHLAKERKASTTLGIIMSAFTVCWLPFFVLALVKPFLADKNAIPNALSSLFLWLGYANSLLNPVIYATLNRDFRRPFQQILYFRCGSLNLMMREEFYQAQFGRPDNSDLRSRQDAPAAHDDDEDDEEYEDVDEPSCDVMAVASLPDIKHKGTESFL